MTRVLRIAVVGVGLALGLAQPLSAQTTTPATPPAPKPAATGPLIKVGTTIFADFTQTTTPTALDAAGHSYHPSAFNITRAYMNITGTLNSVLSFRVTPDIARETNTASALAGSNVMRLKLAYGQVNLDQWSGKFTQTWIRFGLVPIPFVDGHEAIYRYRFHSALYPEREGLLPSADYGVALHSALPGGRGDFQVNVMNGEGYSKAEANDKKSFQGRVSVRPAASSAPEWARAVKLHVFYDHDHYMFDADKKRLLVSATVEHKHMNGRVDVMTSRDELTPTSPLAKGKGWSVFVTPFFKEKGKGPEAFIRIDRFTPDDTKTEQRQFDVVGLAWWWTPAGTGSAAALMLNYEQQTFAHSLTNQPQQRRVVLRTLLNF